MTKSSLFFAIASRLGQEHSQGVVPPSVCLCVTTRTTCCYGTAFGSIWWHRRVGTARGNVTNRWRAAAGIGWLISSKDFMENQPKKYHIWCNFHNSPNLETFFTVTFLLFFVRQPFNFSHAKALRSPPAPPNTWIVSPGSLHKAWKGHVGKDVPVPGAFVVLSLFQIGCWLVVVTKRSEDHKLHMKWRWMK